MISKKEHRCQRDSGTTTHTRFYQIKGELVQAILVITGFAAVSYAGLLLIAASRGYL